MSVKRFEFSIRTEGNCHVIDITERVGSLILESKLQAGLACISIKGSTAAISTVEYEPGLLKDIPEFLQSILPSGRSYHHDATWHDGNGHAHMRSFLLKTSICIPFNEGRLELGTWQQIVLLDFDNRPRQREVIVQIIGE